MSIDQRPVLVFMRGLIRSRYHWAGFPDRFKTQYNVIEVELPGNGYRFNETTPSDIPTMMHSIRHQVREQHSGPITVIAISMGGMIATEWARQFPEEISAMHLINTSLANMSLPWERMSAVGFFRLLACAGSLLKLERTIYSLTMNRPYSLEEQNKWLSFAENHPLRWRNVFIQLLAASRYKGPVTAPIDSVFFYNATHDRLVRSGCTRRIAKRWNKPLLTHPTAGHDLPVDDPEWLEENILTQLESSPQR
jgi:pimeloyl-ACP methyl ester carboxylesterase